MDDKTTIFFNGILLFSVLFFIYPFKLVSYLILTILFSFNDEAIHKIINLAKLPELLALYYFGLVLMNGIFGLLYRHALRYRLHLDLNEDEEKEAFKKYASGILSIPGFAAGILLCFALSPSLVGYSVFPMLALQIINARFRRNESYIELLMPKAVPLSEETV